MLLSISSYSFNILKTSIRSPLNLLRDLPVAHHVHVSAVADAGLAVARIAARARLVRDFVIGDVDEDVGRWCLDGDDVVHVAAVVIRARPSVLCCCEQTWPVLIEDRVGRQGITILCDGFMN